MRIRARNTKSNAAVFEYIRNAAAQSFQQMFQSFERHILLAHFDAMQRRRRNSELAGVFGQRFQAALFAQEHTELLLQGRRHTSIVRRSPSHIWEMNPLFFFAQMFGKVPFSEKVTKKTLRTLASNSRGLSALRPANSRACHFHL